MRPHSSRAASLAATAAALALVLASCASPDLVTPAPVASMPPTEAAPTVEASLDPMSDEAIQARIDALSEVQMCMFQVGGGPPVDAEAAASSPELLTRIQGFTSAAIEDRSDVLAGFNSGTPDPANSSIIVYMAADDPEASWTEVLAGSERLGRYARGLAGEVAFVPISVDFSFGELCAAHQALMDFSEGVGEGEDPIIVGWGIDQATNRMLVQVYEPAYTPEAEARVAALAPAGMLVITKTNEFAVAN